MICLCCGAEVEDSADRCWRCQIPFDDSERSLGVYPVTYEEPGMNLKLHPLGMMMVTKDRLLFHVVTDAMLKEEKKKIKGWMEREEKAIALLQDESRFTALSPREFLAAGPENYALSHDELTSVTYKRSYFNRARWTSGSYAGWRGACLTLAWPGHSQRLRTKITGESPKEERAAIGLFERLWREKLEIIN